MFTRSPRSSQIKVPPRGDSCLAIILVLFNFLLQNGISVLCEEPVTGSSAIPALGAKNLETKSQLSPLAETTMAKEISLVISLSKSIYVQILYNIFIFNHNEQIP